MKTIRHFSLLTLLTASLLSTTAFAGPAPAGLPKDYPLKKCVVSDETIGEHGKPVKVTAPDGTDVYLCCKDCVKEFNKSPEKYAKMVQDAKKKK